MLYSKFIFQAKELVIKQLDNETWYLEPEWKDIICRDLESNLEELEDSYINDWWELENILRLEVDRRNAQDSKTKDVVDWLYQIINTTIEPAMLEEENEYIKNIIEYLKTSHELNQDQNN